MVKAILILASWTRAILAFQSVGEILTEVKSAMRGLLGKSDED